MPPGVTCRASVSHITLSYSSGRCSTISMHDTSWNWRPRSSGCVRSAYLKHRLSSWIWSTPNASMSNSNAVLTICPVPHPTSSQDIGFINAAITASATSSLSTSNCGSPVRQCAISVSFKMCSLVLGGKLPCRPGISFQRCCLLARNCVRTLCLRN